LAYTGPFPYTNAGTAVAIDVNNTSFTGNVSNTGVINPGGIAVTSSTIDGGIYDSGFIGGGISVDSHSVLVSTADGISVTGSIFGGGLTNAGKITAADTGIYVGGVSDFAGGKSKTY
jgi:hypothetical protein